MRRQWMGKELVGRVSELSVMNRKDREGHAKTNKPVLEVPAPALSHGFGGDTDDIIPSVCL